MGACCNSICNNDKPLSEAHFSVDNNKDSQDIPVSTPIIQNNNNNSTLEEKQNILESNQQIRAWGQQKDTFINYNNTNNNFNMDKPDIIDEVFLDNDKDENYINISLMEENEYGINFLNMENNLFDLINELRSNPQSFIDEIEKYKNKLIKENDKYYIKIDNNEFEFEDGAENFDECIEFLKNQKKLEKFEKNQSMFECKKFFVDKNVSDLSFVVIYNLIDITSPENNKIRRDCLMNEKYNKLNITITKDELGKKLYSYYFSFDKL